MPFIEQVPSPSPPPPAIYNTSEHNRKNIPPFDFVNQFHLPNIIPEFDARFKTFEQYRNYRNRRLTSWLCDPDFAMFDGAYCHHQLILRQQEGLLAMRKQIDNQLEELNMQVQVQHNNIELLLLKRAKGLAVRITDTLGRPDTVGQAPFSYPISLWKPSTPPGQRLLPHLLIQSSWKSKRSINLEMNAPNVGASTYMTMWHGQEDWTQDTLVDVPTNHLPQKPPHPEPCPPICTHLSSTNPVDYAEPTCLTHVNSAWNTNAHTAIFMRQNINPKLANDDLESQNASPK